jgi:hypothetical protein
MGGGKLRGDRKTSEQSQIAPCQRLEPSDRPQRASKGHLLRTSIGRFSSFERSITQVSANTSFQPAVRLSPESGERELVLANIGRSSTSLLHIHNFTRVLRLTRWP